MKKYFFDFPVYRLSEQDFQKEEDESLLKDYNQIHLKNGKVASKTSYEKFKEQSTKYRDTWLFNEIIGYIRLYIMGEEIRGEYYQHNTTRIKKTRTKHFKLVTLKLASEKNLFKKNNNEIYHIILDYIQECSKELKKLHIDIENFKEIGRYVNWNQLRSRET